MAVRDAAMLAAVLLVVRVVVVVALGSWSLRTYTATADLRRYQEIAEQPGTPYRDFAVEYPPVSLLVIDVAAGDDVKDTAVRLQWLMFVVDLLVAAMLWVGWRRESSVAYLLYGTPLCLFLYFRVDLVSVALALAALLLARRARERLAGVSLATAVLAKIWPIAVAPALVALGRRRAFAWAGVALLAATFAWAMWGGGDAPLQVLTFRGASGWQVESTVGVLVWMLSTGRIRKEAGAIRVGVVPLWAKGILLVAIAVLVLLAWYWSRQRRLPEGLGATAAIGAVLLLSPILSPQYFIWMTPWAAIAAGDGERQIGRLMLLVTFLTVAMWAFPLSLGATQAAILVRNALLVGTVGLAFVRLRSRPQDADLVRET